MPRGLALLLAVPPLLLIVAAALTVDDLPSLIVAKVSEGGLWTGLAAFLMLAIVLAFRPRRDAQSRASAKAK